MSEGGAVEVCAESRGSSDRVFLPLEMTTSAGSELLIIGILTRGMHRDQR